MFVAWNSDADIEVSNQGPQNMKPLFDILNLAVINMLQQSCT